MISQLPKHIFRFILLISFQILILNQMEIGGYIIPLVYIYWVLLLPFEIPTYLLLLLAFGMGISVDMFTGNIGVNAAATVFMAFFRPVVIQNISSKRDFESGVSPRIKDMGVQWFITYVVVCTFLHHFLLFFIETLSFSEFWSTMGRILLSSFFTIVIIVCTEMIFGKSKGK